VKTTTNSLVAKAKGFAVPAGAAATLLLTASFLLGRGTAQTAASDPPPLNTSTLSPLISVDNAVEAIAARITPAVVTVYVTAKASPDQGEQQNGGGFGGIPPQDLPPGFRFFFGPGNGQGQQQQPQYEHAVGSGVIISPDGYIITNHHVVDGATQIKVTLDDRRIFPARVVGIDKLNDLAIIKINATDLPTATWGDSTRLKPGETVLAFGNPFGSFEFSVTRGIVSAVNRANPYETNRRTPGDFIQTDAAINPGNSGGPLVDSYGRVVGIDTFIISDSGSFAGAGFAIPSQIAEASANQIIKTGTVRHGYLGISIEDVTPENASFFDVPNASGAIVGEVTPGSPADQGGMKRGDVVREINGRTIDNASALQVTVSEMAPGTPIHLDVLRDGKPVTLNVTVGEFHANGEQAENGESGQSQHARLGMSVQNLTPDLRQQLNVPTNIQGVAIQSVRSGSGADAAGLAPGNVIMQVNRHPVTSAEEFVNQIHAIPAGKNILLLVWSQGGTGYVVVQPNENGSNNSQ